MANVFSQKESKRVDELAQLMYLRSKDSKDKKWKDLTEEQKDEQRANVCAFVDNMAKLEYEPRPLNEVYISRAKLRATELDLTNFIKKFIQDRVKVPSNLIQIFPYGELAAQITRSFCDAIVDKKEGETQSNAKKDIQK